MPQRKNGTGLSAVARKGRKRNVSVPPDSSADGHYGSGNDAHPSLATAELPNGAADHQAVACESLSRIVPASLIDEIRAHHRERVFAMEQRKRINLALGAYLRMALGWRKDLPEKERKEIAEQAQAIMDGDPSPWSGMVMATEMGRKPFEEAEKKALKEMEKLAGQLPVWKEFGEPIRGFGLASLGVIVAEAGDLRSFANHSKLWKRMGLAVIDGIRQGGLRKGADAEDWIEHGYNRQRRSRMWNIGDALIKGNRDGKYRTAYLARKKYEVDRDPEMKPIHAHRRAQRYIEKKLLRDLWHAWRRAGQCLSERTRLDMPVAYQLAAE